MVFWAGMGPILAILDGMKKIPVSFCTERSGVAESHDQTEKLNFKRLSNVGCGVLTTPNSYSSAKTKNGVVRTLHPTDLNLRL